MNGANPNLFNALRGPVILITIGVLFLLDKLTPFQFVETWPVILIVLGVLALAGGSRQQYGSGGATGMPPGASNMPPGMPPGMPPNGPPNVPPMGGRR